ncbi:hypothetical protein BABINDRAFT_160560 [Babjeviella inositovora NRRL Y-12698]|uniref:Cytochrome c oxidase copper chaperone n=1 Tax=Babjeviella inositovora NRRL Y-12698 TaxID=984486 RepID=A0A1E3QU01_9ASCO|nr:uncharacterized protein BABINDRAFT_160560 [Babjeviella inositovora NRRL Y-12698]ODQ81163.1 hypothetical protein BABINDRAFT_160560 [Babjeviella inositovora NRRL Y-12698]
MSKVIETQLPVAATPVEACPVKPKPCCVCKDEKAVRDECLLFNGQESGKCDSLIEKYKVCMKGFGFETR